MASEAPSGSRVLELPDSGPGSAGGIGRRIAALFIDWFACLAVALAVTGGLQSTAGDPGVVALAVFFAEVTILTWLQGASFGQRLLGLVVAPVGRPRVTALASAVRTLLLCLVIPAVVMQPNGRGLHDLAAGTVVVRRG